MVNMIVGTGVLPRTALRAMPRPVRFGQTEAPAEKPGLITTLKSKEDFDQALASTPGPLLAKFEKKDCPACQQVEPTVTQLAQENTPALKVVKVWMWDADNPGNRSLKRVAGDYKIKTVPMFILFNQGKEIARGEGASGLTQIVADQKLKLNSYPDHIPKPYEPPGAILTVLFDGECRICKGTAEKMKKLDKNNKLALVPLQAPSVREKYPDLKLVDLRKTIHVVTQDGKVYKGAESFRELGKVIKAHNLFGFSLKAFKLASKIPGVLKLTDKLYLAFSKRRFMFEAKKADCKNCTLDD